jgi:methylenetetrahydrofolate--tRNA-(uracil-5-)-methyltransferase
MEHTDITIIGAGLAGCEAAWQASRLGASVALVDMKPRKLSAAHTSTDFAELVCSNSLGANSLESAKGLLKQELREMGSLVIECADRTGVPAGGALAVDRARFARLVTEKIKNSGRIFIHCAEAEELPDAAACIVATGPLTSDPMSSAIARLLGQDSLYFFDAAAPIVERASIDESKTFLASRYGKGAGAEAAAGAGIGSGAAGSGAAGPAGADSGAADSAPEPGAGGAEGAAGDSGTGCAAGAAGEPCAAGAAGDSGAGCAAGAAGEPCAAGAAGDSGAAEGDYINCPMDKPQYERFVSELLRAETAEVKGFEERMLYEGCMPLESMARRGFDALRFGPLKPKGLFDPATGREPYAVAQLRRDNAEGTLYNLVGFQTRLRFGEQKRVFGLLPGLEGAEFARYGVMHRNTFIKSPGILDARYALRPGAAAGGAATGCGGVAAMGAGGPAAASGQTARRALFFAGQLAGVEGYAESVSSGLVAGINAAMAVLGGPPAIFPPNTLIGALAGHVSSYSGRDFQPMGASFGILGPLDRGGRLRKRERHRLLAERSLDAIRQLRLRLRL